MCVIVCLFVCACVCGFVWSRVCLFAECVCMFVGFMCVSLFACSFARVCAFVCVRVVFMLVLDGGCLPLCFVNVNTSLLWLVEVLCACMFVCVFV